MVDNFLVFPEVVVGKIILSEELFASPGTESVEKSVKTVKKFTTIDFALGLRAFQAGQVPMSPQS